MTITCTPPEGIQEIPKKVSGYVSELNLMMANCKICGGVTIACPTCLKADEVLVWIQHNLNKIKRLESK